MSKQYKKKWHRQQQTWSDYYTVGISWESVANKVLFFSLEQIPPFWHYEWNFSLLENDYGWLWAIIFWKIL